MKKYVTNLTLPNGTNLLIKDSECRTNLSNEIDRATKKETWLQTNIDTVEQAREDGENRLQQSINTEQSAREDFDHQLHQTIINETNRATKKETALQNSIEAINNAQHPIGSIYMSMNSNSPASIFGGTWEQLKKCFLFAAGDNYKAGSTGGEYTHVLTVNEMPTHTHSIGRGWGTDTGETRFVYAESAQKYANWSDAELKTYDTGGSQPHNNMPPYLAVYMWKRIA